MPKSGRNKTRSNKEALSRIDVVLKCKGKNHFTKKQKSIEKKLKKTFWKNNQGKSFRQTNVTKTRTEKRN